MRRDTGLTYDLLHGISTKLSGRHDCRHIEYHVTIFDGHIVMFPIIYVFPDPHHRRDHDKCDVVDYVLHNMHSKFDFSESNDLVDGTYLYQLSTKGNVRKWTSKSYVESL